MHSLLKPGTALLGAMLLAGELAIAVLSLWFPAESQMYKDFYIAHSRDCWLPAATQTAVAEDLAGPELDPPSFSPQAACFAFAHGWRPSPYLGEIGDPRSAWLDLPPPPRARTLEITLANTSLQVPQSVQVSLGRYSTARVVLPPNRAQVDLQLPLTVPLSGAAWSGRYVQVRFNRMPAPDGSPIAVLRLKWMD